MSVIHQGNSISAPISPLARLSKPWKRWITPQAVDPNDAFRERTVRGMVPILAFLLFGSACFLLATKQTTAMFVPIIGTSSLIIFSAGVAIANKRLNLASALAFFFPVVAAVVSLMTWGYLSPAGIIMSYLAVLLGAVILPRKITNFLPLGMIIVYGILAFKVGPNGRLADPTNADPTGPLAQTIKMAILSTMFFGIGYYLLNEFEKRREALVHLVGTLEDRVAARTRDLALAADVAKETSTELVLEKLLPQLVERTRDGFKLYSVAVFFLDDDNETLAYEAGTGVAGQQQKANRKHFKISDQGLVPKTARTRTMLLANDVSLLTDHLRNPYLPDTRAELCLPMMVGDRLVGVLDLQSELVDRFTKDDLKVMTALSEQLAVAIQNARLFEQQVKITEQLRAVDTMKSQFLASMSHELRTPLNAILNFTEFVAMGIFGPVNEEQEDALNKTLESGRHLLSLINDVLDIAKIEAGMMTLLIDDNIDIRAELEPVIATAQTLLKDKPVRFVAEIDPALPALLGDKRRIRQILLNLISNAAKFTDEGKVTLRVENHDTSVQFAVIDTGPGIAQEDQKLIFEPFVQTETGIKHAGGTGLGLPISSRLAEAHGGKLWIQSEPGQGASFYVSLPTRNVTLLKSLESAQELQHA